MLTQRTTAILPLKPLIKEASWYVSQDLPYTALPFMQTWLLGYLEHDKNLVFAYALCATTDRFE